MKTQNGLSRIYPALSDITDSSFTVKKNPAWIMNMELRMRLAELRSEKYKFKPYIDPFEKRHIEIIIDDDLLDEWMRGNRNYRRMDKWSKTYLVAALKGQMKYKKNEGLTIMDYCPVCAYPKHGITHAFAFPDGGTCYHILNV